MPSTRGGRLQAHTPTPARRASTAAATVEETPEPVTATAAITPSPPFRERAAWSLGDVDAVAAAVDRIGSTGYGDSDDSGVGKEDATPAAATAASDVGWDSDEFDYGVGRGPGGAGRQSSLRLVKIFGSKVGWVGGRPSGCCCYVVDDIGGRVG